MKREKGNVCSPNLQQKQQVMQKAAGDSFGEATIIFLCLIGTLLLIKPDFRIDPVGDALLCVLLLAIMVVYVIRVCCCYGILRRLYAITSPAGQEVHITCKRVSLLRRTVSKYTRVLVCVVFIGQKGEKYYHILNDPLLMDKSVAKQFKQYKNREIKLTCYKGAQILKSFP